MSARPQPTRDKHHECVNTGSDMMGCVCHDSPRCISVRERVIYGTIGKVRVLALQPDTGICFVDQRRT